MIRTQLDVRLFEVIPGWVGKQVRPCAERVAAELLEEILAVGGEEYERVRTGIIDGLSHFCDLLEAPESAWEPACEFYLRLGRRMAAEGRELDEMHQGLRWSALAIWRSLTADRHELDQSTLRLVADAQFGYLEAVAAVITAGYLAETMESTEATRRRRSRLLSLLLSDPSPDGQAVVASAREARWPLPAEVAAVVIQPRRAGSTLAVPNGCLADLGGTEPHLLVPDPDGPGRARLLEPMLRDWIVAIGPTTATARAAESLRWARETMALARRGVIPAIGLLRATDHVPSLVIFESEQLIGYAAAARLAPLDGLSPLQRARLIETMQALLENNFNATDASVKLKVHPQTVRYRLRHLQELFGEDLQDPNRCFEMEMILRAQNAGVPHL